jgi:hypothetical protein
MDVWIEGRHVWVIRKDNLLRVIVQRSKNVYSWPLNNWSVNAFLGGKNLCELLLLPPPPTNSNSTHPPTNIPPHEEGLTFF